MMLTDIMSVISGAGVPAFDGARKDARIAAGAYVYLLPETYEILGPGGNAELRTSRVRIRVVAYNEAKVREWTDAIRSAFFNETWMHVDSAKTVFKSGKLYESELTGRLKEWLI